ncbi:pentapeptide repeat-containing protein, partial [Litoreibacter halocynthiae]|uniref:pentapeptide repeat-containing protein n=1 Tax=Litoreibacter halocynthiae TaxID=1242689 RepID=UPI00249012C9
MSVPTALFFYVAPGLGAAVYAYFHLHLLKLWEQLSLAPAQVDNVPLSDNIAPWLIADYALVQRPDGALRNRPLGRLAHYVVGGLAFWAAPLLLAAFWFRSMPKHDPWLTGLAIGIPLIFTIYVGKRSHEQLVSLMKPDATIRMVSNIAWSIVAVVTLLFGQMASYGIYDDDPQRKGLNVLAVWPVSADLSGVAFTTLPAGWQSFDVARNAYRRDWCRQRGVSSLACGEVDFSGTIPDDDLTHSRNDWCAQYLTPVRNCTAYFKEFDQKFAISWSQIRSANLETANKTNLQGKDLRRAYLWKARLEGANLREANLEGAILSAANL